MKSLSGVGLGLSLVFGCLLVALLAELYYLLWWKKKSIANAKRRRINRDNEEGCWKNPSSISCAQELCSSSSSVHEPQSSMELWLKKPFRDRENLPRFLFTIAEETNEDLESEDGNNINNVVRDKSIGQCTSRSNLSDLLQILETPFLTPMGSPHYFTPPQSTPSSSSSTSNDDNRQRLNNNGQVLESERDAAFNRLMSSPPPKFKFLRDAEEKLLISNQTRKIFMEQTGNGVHDSSDSSVVRKDEENNGQFITIIVAKSQQDEKEEELNSFR